MKKKLRILILFSIILIIGGCNILVNGPVAVAKTVFKQWAHDTITPYRNENFQLTSNDGTFAVVHLTVDLRRSAQDNWTAMETNINCQKVGNDWSCDQFLNFSLSRSLIVGTQMADAAIATAASLSAKATQQALSLLSVPKKADNTIYVYTMVSCLDDSISCKTVTLIGVAFTLTNNDKQSHAVKVGITVRSTIHIDQPDLNYETSGVWEGMVSPGKNKIIAVHWINDCSVCLQQIRSDQEYSTIDSQIKIIEIDGISVMP